MSEKERKIGKKLAETFDALPDNAVFEVSPIDYADHTHLIHNNTEYRIVRAYHTPGTDNTELTCTKG